jgi:hypothetical protein
MLAHLTGESSNRLFKVFSEWSAFLESVSIDYSPSPSPKYLARTAWAEGFELFHPFAAHFHIEIIFNDWPLSPVLQRLVSLQINQGLCL